MSFWHKLTKGVGRVAGAVLGSGAVGGGRGRDVAQAAGALMTSSAQSAAAQRQVDATNRANKEINESNQRWSSAEAQKGRDWMQGMANTAHQREVSDLRLAGLNPILSANNGADTPGAGIPTAQSNAMQAYTGQSSDFANSTQALDNIGTARSLHDLTPLQRDMYISQRQQTDAQTRLTGANADLAEAAAVYAHQFADLDLTNLASKVGLTSAQTRYINGPQTDLTNAETSKTMTQIKNIDANTKLMNAQRFQIIQLTPYQIANIASSTVRNYQEGNAAVARANYDNVQSSLAGLIAGKISSETYLNTMRAEGVKAEAARDLAEAAGREIKNRWDRAATPDSLGSGGLLDKAVAGARTAGELISPLGEVARAISPFLGR